MKPSESYLEYRSLDAQGRIISDLIKRAQDAGNQNAVDYYLKLKNDINKQKAAHADIRCTGR